MSLPTATTSTIMLTMTNDEDRAFNRINSKSTSTLERHISEGVKVFTCENIFRPKMASILQSNEHTSLSEIITAGNKHHHRYVPERLSKIVALRQDLAKQKKMAVVFTQYLGIHDACVRGLAQDGFEVYQFTGSSDSTKRELLFATSKDLPHVQQFSLSL